jgi:hypothetical protein
MMMMMIMIIIMIITMSISPSIRMEHLGSAWKDVSNILYWGLAKEIC